MYLYTRARSPVTLPDFPHEHFDTFKDGGLRTKQHTEYKLCGQQEEWGLSEPVGKREQPDEKEAAKTRYHLLSKDLFKKEKKKQW